MTEGQNTFNKSKIQAQHSIRLTLVLMILEVSTYNVSYQGKVHFYQCSKSGTGSMIFEASNGCSNYPTQVKKLLHDIHYQLKGSQLVIILLINCMLSADRFPMCFSEAAVANNTRWRKTGVILFFFLFSIYVMKF